MYIYFLFLGIIVGGALLFKLYFSELEIKQKKALHYKKKQYLLTQAERKFFEVLEQAVGDKYYIFPQIHLASLLYVEKRDREWQKYFNKIIKKSVDFVLCDKQYLSPVIAIELNDSSHLQERRKERDVFVQEAMESAGLKLVVVRAQWEYDVEEVRNYLK